MKVKHHSKALLLLVLFVLDSSLALAGAQHFVGWYKLSHAKNLSESGEPEYLLVDNDSLENIWFKYANGPLPDNLVQYKTEPTILAGFSQREFLILSFEKFAIINDRYLKLSANSDLLELYRQDSGVFQLATRENGIIDRYSAVGPSATPEISVESIKIWKNPQFQWFVTQE